MSRPYQPHMVSFSQSPTGSPRARHVPVEPVEHAQPIQCLAPGVAVRYE